MSWKTVLKKRAAFRAAFCNFDAKKIPKFDSKKINLLLNNPDIIRNRLKINATIQNAKTFLEVKKEWGSFANHIWVSNRFSGFHFSPATTANPESVIFHAPILAALSIGQETDMLSHCRKYDTWLEVVPTRFPRIGKVINSALTLFNKANIAGMTF